MLAKEKKKNTVLYKNIFHFLPHLFAFIIIFQLYFAFDRIGLTSNGEMNLGWYGIINDESKKYITWDHRRVIFVDILYYFFAKEEKIVEKKSLSDGKDDDFILEMNKMHTQHYWINIYTFWCFWYQPEDFYIIFLAVITIIIMFIL